MKRFDYDPRGGPSLSDLYARRVKLEFQLERCAFLLRHRERFGTVDEKFTLRIARIEADLATVRVTIAAGLRPSPNEPAVATKLKDPPPNPPAFAEIVLGVILPAQMRESALEEAAELFDRNLGKGMSLSRARRFYWVEVARSAAPLGWCWIKRIGIFGMVVDFVRRFTA